MVNKYDADFDDYDDYDNNKNDDNITNNNYDIDDDYNDEIEFEIEIVVVIDVWWKNYDLYVTMISIDFILSFIYSFRFQ